MVRLHNYPHEQHDKCHNYDELKKWATIHKPIPLSLNIGINAKDLPNSTHDNWVYFRH